MLYICPHRTTTHEPSAGWRASLSQLEKFELKRSLCVCTASVILALVLTFGSATVYPNLRKQEGR